MNRKWKNNIVWGYCSLAVLYSFSSPAIGDYIVSTGQASAFASQNPPYEPETFMVQVILGYGSDSNSIGDGVWIDQPGIYDFSADPNFDEYVSYLTNGIDDPYWITIVDQDGYPSVYYFNTWGEAMFSGQYPDLAQYTIHGARINVIDLFVGSPDNGAKGGVYFYADYIGAPEPSSLMLSYAFLFITRKGIMIS